MTEAFAFDWRSMMPAISMPVSIGTMSNDVPSREVMISSIPNGEVHGITEDAIALVMTENLFLQGDHLPHISLSRTIFMQSSGQVLRDAKIEFWLEGRTLSGQQRKLTNASIVERQENNINKLCLRIEYEHALVAGADNIEYTWPDTLKFHLSELLEVRDNNVCFIPLPSSSEKYLDEIRSKLDEYRHHVDHKTLRPFYSPSEEQIQQAAASRTKSGMLLRNRLEPITDWPSMEKLHNAANGFPKISASNTFSSLTSANIILSNAVYLENAWEESIIEMLSGGTEVSFVVLSKKVVLAFVRYKDRKQIKGDILLNDRMEIEVTSSIEVAVDSEGNPISKSQEAKGEHHMEEQSFSVSGMLVANRTDIEEADFVVMIKKRKPLLYRAATKLKAGDLIWRESIVSIVENRSQAEKQINAMSSLCNPNSYHRRFHDVLLAENLAAGSPERWLLDIVGQQGIIDSALSDVLDKARSMKRPLNPQQESILKNVQFSYRSTDIIRGPPGCGKTTLIAAVAEFLVRCSDDIGLFLCAPSNGNTQRIHEAVRYMTRSKPSIVTEQTRERDPQRVYRKHLEEEHLLHSQDEHGKKEDEQADEIWAAPFLTDKEQVSTDASWYARMADADKKREMDDPTIGVTAYVVAEVQRNPYLRVVGKIADDRCNVVPVFIQYLEKLKQQSFKKWKAKDKGRFKDAWAVLAKHFVGQKHIVCCTVGNITSALMARALRNFKHAVIIIDEASLMTDPALWNAVVNVVSQIRCENEYGGTSPVIKLMLIGDEAQGYPLVKTEDAAFNCFGSQLARSPYERLVMAGGNVQEMWEQFRMVPALCEIPNKRWYGGKLRCSEERRTTRLSTKHKELLEQFFAIEYPASVTDAEDSQAAMDNHLRLLLANVPEGQCQVEPHTQSRLNMGNVDIIMKIFRDLIHKNRQGMASGPGDVVILTFYNAQRRRLLNALLDLEKELGLSEGALDSCLHTVDSYQGREAKYVILDTTVCTYYGEGSLGHAGDERKACVAATRAREVMIVVGNLNILKANLKHEARVPFVIDLLKTLKERGANKTFHTDAKPEKQIGAKLDSELQAEALKEKENGSTSDTADINTPGEDSSDTAVEEVDVRTWDDLKAAVYAMGLRDGP